MLIFRKLRLFKKSQFILDVVQLSLASVDDDIKILLRDILHATLDHCSASSSPLLVHSSTVRGVTGVFIALFKIWEDFYNSE